jgi:hypothetical protein
VDLDVVARWQLGDSLEQKRTPRVTRIHRAIGAWTGNDRWMPTGDQHAEDRALDQAMATKRLVATFKKPRCRQTFKQHAKFFIPAPYNPEGTR